jgi:toprim domain protein
MDDRVVIIVEGKNDRRRLRRLLPDADHVTIVMTYGIPTESRLHLIRRAARDAEVFIFTDADATGRRIRGILREAFPDAHHLYTKASYRGVETTPLEYLAERLRAVGLEPYDEEPDLTVERARMRSGRNTKSAKAIRPAPK